MAVNRHALYGEGRRPIRPSDRHVMDAMAICLSRIYCKQNVKGCAEVAGLFDDCIGCSQEVAADKLRRFVSEDIHRLESDHSCELPHAAHCEVSMCHVLYLPHQNR